MPTLNTFSIQQAAGKRSQPSPPTLASTGPILNVLIEIPGALAQSFNTKNTPVPPPVTGIALVDTAASITSFDESVAQRLGLSPVGTAPVGTAGGKGTRSIYQARFTFPGTPLPGFEHPNVLGCDLSGQTVLDQQPIIALIGRDILANAVLVYNGLAGFWSLSF
jgi:hypothetical protein